MKWKLIAIIERLDGTIFRQCVRTLTEDESVDNELINRALSKYKDLLGDDYLIMDYYVGY